jgi:Putative transposase/Transposase zinc-binding domain
VLLGHAKLENTALYTRVATKTIQQVMSPLEHIALKLKSRTATRVSRPALEVADIFRGHGPAWRQANAGHVSLDQLKVMSAIESCRTAALGGHVARCEDCAYTTVAYNSCRNRHCPKCQGAAAREWLAEREAELLPVPYFHVVFTLPAAIGDIAYQNKAVIYDLLFKASAETLITIAADPKHLGARVGITAVLHTWGSALTHHPHVHMIVPGGGISLDGTRWVSCRPGFFLPVRVLSRLFRRLFLERLTAAHKQLQFFGTHAPLVDAKAFARYLAPMRKTEWVVYSKRPFGGPEAVLAYLSRYTHRVAIANSRLIAFDQNGVTFRWKDYRIEGRDRYKTMTLATDEFIRRFLIHVLPKGFHRIRHYGLLAKAVCADNIARARELLTGPKLQSEPAGAAADHNEPACPCCGGRMFIIETFQRGSTPRHQPKGPMIATRIDTS